MGHSTPRRRCLIAVFFVVGAGCSSDDGSGIDHEFGAPRVEIVSPGSGDAPAQSLWPLSLSWHSPATGFVGGSVEIGGRVLAVVEGDYTRWLIARDAEGVWVYGRLAGLSGEAKLYRRPYLFVPSKPRDGMRWRMRDVIEPGDDIEVSIHRRDGVWDVSTGPGGLRNLRPGWGPTRRDIVGVNDVDDELTPKPAPVVAVTPIGPMPLTGGGARLGNGAAWADADDAASLRIHMVLGGTKSRCLTLDGDKVLSDATGCSDALAPDDGSEPGWSGSGRLPPGILTARRPADATAPTTQWVRVTAAGEVDLLRVVDRRTGHFERRRAGRIDVAVASQPMAAWLRLRGDDDAKTADLYVVTGTHYADKSDLFALSLSMARDVALSPWEPLGVEQTWHSVLADRDIAVCWSSAYPRGPDGTWTEDIVGGGAGGQGPAYHGPYFDPLSHCSLLVRDLGQSACADTISAAGTFGERGRVRVGVGVEPSRPPKDGWGTVALLRGGGFVTAYGLYGLGRFLRAHSNIKTVGGAIAGQAVADKSGAGLWVIGEDDQGVGVALVNTSVTMFRAPGAPTSGQVYRNLRALAGDGVSLEIDVGSGYSPFVLVQSGAFSAIDATVSGLTQPLFKGRLQDGTLCGVGRAGTAAQLFCRDASGGVKVAPLADDGQWHLMDSGDFFIVSPSAVHRFDPKTMVVKLLDAVAAGSAAISDSIRALDGDEIYLRRYNGAVGSSVARITSAGAIERIDLFGGAATSCFSHSVANVGAIIPDRHVLVIRDAGGQRYRVPRPTN